MLEFEEGYSWFNWHIEYESFLSEPVSKLICLMKDALEKGDYLQAEHYIGLSNQVCQSLGNGLEIGEASLECGYAYFQMDSLSKSIPFFRQAINHFSAQNVHNRAIALWMLGCVFWKTEKQSDAIVLWERGCRIFQELRSVRADTDWYGKASEKMCCALQVEIDNKTGLEEIV